MLTKRLIILFAIFAAGIASAQTNIDSQRARFYVQPSVGIASLGKDFKSAGAVSVAAGTSWATHHSVELDYTFFKTEPDVINPIQDLKYTILLATYKYTWALRHNLSVYGGASIGQVSQKVTPRVGYQVIGSDTERKAAFGLCGGVTYRIDPHVVLDGCIKLVGLQETKFTTNGSLALIQGGVRFEF